MRYGVISDIHAPFHGPEYELALFVLTDLKIKTLIINGDFLDFYGCNLHGPRHPEIQTYLEDEIHWGREELKRLRKKFDRIIFCLGNHETRLERFILQKCPTVWGFFNLARMLNCEELGIEVIPYQQEFLITENLRVMHSPPSYSENLAMTSLKKKPGASFIYGCSHRIDFAVKNLSNGGQCEVYSNGWLGSTDLTNEHQHVFSYTKNHQNWQHGFAIVDIDTAGDHHVEQIHIKNKKCKADGFLWEI